MTLSLGNLVQSWATDPQESYAGPSLLPVRPYSVYDYTLGLQVVPGQCGDRVVVASTLNGRPRLHALDTGPVGDGLFPDYPPPALTPDDLWVIPCAGRRLLFARDTTRGIAVADLDAQRGAARLRIPVTGAIAVIPLGTGFGEPSILVVSRKRASVFAVEPILAALDAPLRRGDVHLTREYLPSTWRSLRMKPIHLNAIQPPRAPRRLQSLTALKTYDWPDTLRPSLAKLSPAGHSCVLVSGNTLGILPLLTRGPAKLLEIESKCQDLEFGPDGEIVLATRSGTLVIDPVPLPPAAPPAR